MIRVSNLRDCCGCSACAQVCPRQCVSMREDSEGFLYPVADRTRCVDCGLCERVCPLREHSGPLRPLGQWVAVNASQEERMASSSGGVFVLLAKEVLLRGGVVFGAVYDEHWEVRHVWTDNVQGLARMMGSKYVQSRMGNAYREVRAFLQSGREVLFTGTPCQVAGLRCFLRQREFPQLLTVEVLCHGVPSVDVWRRYLTEMCDAVGGMPKGFLRTTAGKVPASSSSLGVIGDIRFRDKTESGWKRYRFVVHGHPAAEGGTGAVLLSVPHENHPFMRGFLANLFLRPSCHACRCKCGRSHADLTLGDYWAAWTVDQELDDDKGLSLVVVNTPHGRDRLAGLDLVMHETTWGKACLWNGGFSALAPPHPRRSRFFALIHGGMPVSRAVEVCLRVPLRVHAARKIKAWLRGIVSALHVWRAV